MAHLHVNFQAHGAQIKQAYDGVIGAPAASADNLNTCYWAIFGYDKGTNDLLVQHTGSGLLEDLGEEFNDSQIQFGFCRVFDEDSRLPKYILINWCGEGVPVSRKALVSSHLIDVRQQLRGFHLEISARSIDDLDPVEIIKKVKKSSGSKYSHQQVDLRLRKDIADDSPTAPVGAAYKRPEIVKASFVVAAAKPPPPTPITTTSAVPSGDQSAVGAAVGTRYQRPEIPLNIRTAAKDGKSEFERHLIVANNTARSPVSPASSDGWGESGRGGAVSTEPPPIEMDPVKRLREERQRADKELMDRERRASFRATVDGKAGRVAFNEGRKAGDGEELVDPVRRIRLERERQEKELMERERRNSIKRDPKNSPFAAAKAFAEAAASGGGVSSPPSTVSAAAGTTEEMDSVRRIRSERERQEKELMERERRAAEEREQRSAADAKSAAAQSPPASSRVAAALVHARRASFDRQQQQQQKPAATKAVVSSVKNSFVPTPAAAASAVVVQSAAAAKPVASPVVVVEPPAAPASVNAVDESAVAESQQRVAIPVRKFTEEVDQTAVNSDGWSDAGESKAAPSAPANQSISALADPPSAYTAQQQPQQQSEYTEPEQQAEAAAEQPVETAFPAENQEQNIAAADLSTAHTHAVPAASGSGLCATALYDYSATEENEMSIQTGDLISNIQQLDEFWWYGNVMAGETLLKAGLFPANYCQLVTDNIVYDNNMSAQPAVNNAAEIQRQEPAVESYVYQSVTATMEEQVAPPAADIPVGDLLTVRVLYDYEAGDTNELTIRAGEILFNVQQVSADWWSGQNEQGYVGLFPANYVELFG